MVLATEIQMNSCPGGDVHYLMLHGQYNYVIYTQYKCTWARTLWVTAEVITVIMCPTSFHLI